MNKVYIINKSAHDFEPAAKFGELIFLSEGSANRFAVNSIYRQFSEYMKDSSPNDYIVLCSLNIMNVVACSIFVAKHKRLNLLLFKDGKYLERNIKFV